MKRIINLQGIAYERMPDGSIGLPILTTRPEPIMRASLPTLGGTAVEVTPASMPPVPPAAWFIFVLGLGALVVAARRGGETSPAPCAPRRGSRTEPLCEGSVERMKPFPAEA